VDDHQAELDYERAINATYWAALNKKRHYNVAGQHKRAEEVWGCLTARIRFADSPEDDPQIYIGPRYLADLQGVSVVSWAAPMADVHFKQLDEWDGRRVLVRRVFQEEAARITDFFQEPGRIDGPAFPRQLRRPNLPPGPDPAITRGDDARSVEPESWAERRDQSLTVAAEQRKQDALGALRRHRPGGLRPPGPAKPKPEPTSPEELAASAETTQMSREEHLRDTMRAPRTGRLDPVLATLRSDQHAAVTWPLEENLIVEGHPGTGKSIVATHRAAWLVNPHRSGPRLPNDVLVVGPTHIWREHVLDSMKQLGDGQSVRTRYLNQIMGDLIGLQPFEGAMDGQLEAVAEETGRFIQRMVAHFRPTTGRKWLPTGYQVLRSWNAGEAGMHPSSDLERWRHNLPDYTRAQKDLRLWPALAFLAGQLERPARASHLIVDEAQDIRPLEWMVLSLFDPDTWTLVGDLNQRRAESSHRSWTALTDLIGGDWKDPVRLDLGYRSTQAIMDVASSLLPKGQRRSTAVLGRGPRVIVLSVAIERAALVQLALRSATSMWNQYAPGSVALIYPHPRVIQDSLRQLGWESEPGSRWRWQPTGRPAIPGKTPEFTLLSPTQARGIEFDAVVVVEPAEFPRTTLIGNGPLYTALTRANQQLVIVHDKPIAPRALADALKRADPNS